MSRKKFFEDFITFEIKAHFPSYTTVHCYTYRFDDGDELDEIQDLFVMDKSEYLISTSKVGNDGNIQSEWLGVRNNLDKTSIDEWANDVG